MGRAGSKCNRRVIVDRGLIAYRCEQCLIRTRAPHFTLFPDRSAQLDRIFRNHFCHKFTMPLERLVVSRVADKVQRF